MVRLDLQYSQNWSLWLDLKISWLHHAQWSPATVLINQEADVALASFRGGAIQGF